MIKKTLLTVTSLLIISFITKAQSNLQFNKVLTYSGHITGAATSDTFRVPMGKVWKIENKTVTGITSPSGYNLYFSINNIGFDDGFFSSIENSYGAALRAAINQRITWLKAGDFIYFTSETAGNNYFISIIEYNITQ